MVLSQCIIIKEPQNITDEKRFSAAKILNGAAYKLYTYLVSFPEGENIYDRADFIKKIGVALNSANKAFDELIQNNFLVSKNDLTYFFYYESRK